LKNRGPAPAPAPSKTYKRYSKKYRGPAPAPAPSKKYKRYSKAPQKDKRKKYKRYSKKHRGPCKDKWTPKKCIGIKQKGYCRYLPWLRHYRKGCKKTCGACKKLDKNTKLNWYYKRGSTQFNAARIKYYETRYASLSLALKKQEKNLKRLRADRDSIEGKISKEKKGLSRDLKKLDSDPKPELRKVHKQLVDSSVDSYKTMFGKHSSDIVKHVRLIYDQISKLCKKDDYKKGDKGLKQHAKLCKKYSRKWDYGLVYGKLSKKYSKKYMCKYKSFRTHPHRRLVCKAAKKYAAKFRL